MQAALRSAAADRHWLYFKAPGVFVDWDALMEQPTYLLALFVAQPATMPAGRN